MSGNAKIERVDIPSLAIIYYPDPRLREVCEPVEDPTAPAVRAMVERMFELMFASRGVGLAAPQVGVTVRLFVASPTVDEQDKRIYINPQIISTEGRQDGEEGCLSLPGVTCKIKRAASAAIRASGLDGKVFEETGEFLAARIFQHEIDHLNGRLLLDRMGSVARLANRKALKQLEAHCAEGGP